MPESRSENARCSSTFWVAGIEACAQKRASTREVARTSLVSRLMVRFVKMNNATTSRPLSGKRNALTSPGRGPPGPVLTRRSILSPRLRLEALEPVEVRPERRGDAHGAGFGLVMLEERGVGPRQRNARGVQRVGVLGA